MSYSHTVEWDSASDGTFSTDITGYVMECRINRGRRTDLGKMPAGTATLVLNNHDGRFSPDKADGPYFGLLEMYRRVRITGTVVGASTYGMFYGFLLDWDNKPRISQQYVTWFLGDRFALWQYLRLYLPLIRNMDILPALHLAVNRAEGLNVIANPSLEQNATGWSALGAATGARDDTMKGEGDWTYRADCPGTAGGEGARYTATADYDTDDYFRAGIIAKCSEGTVSVRFRAIGAGAELAGFNYTLTTSWQYLPLYWTVTSQWAAGVKYFDLYTNQASEVIIWVDALQGWEGIEAVHGMTRDFDSGTAEIELASSYRQPSLPLLQDIAESEPRSFFFPYCDTTFKERLRFRDKKWRDAGIPTINYVKDPSFEHSTLTDHWYFVSGTGFSRSTEQAEYGSYSLKLATSGMPAATYRNIHQIIADRPAASEGEVWTLSAYFYPTVLTNIEEFRLTLSWYDAGDNFLSSTDGPLITQVEADFVHSVITGTAPANTAKCEASVRIKAGAGGGGAITCYFDGCQLEQRVLAIDYCDGDQPGCVWAGAAHESISSRVSATLQASFRDLSLATVNHLKDPSFEHNILTDYWGIHVTTDSRDWEADEPYGSYALQKEGSGLAENWYTTSSLPLVAASEGEVWTGSAYFNSWTLTNIDQLRVLIQFLDAEEGSVGTYYGTNVNSTDGWLRSVITATAPADTAYVRLRLGCHVGAGGAGAIKSFIDGCQLEEASAVTRYCDGDQPGGVWAGTAHESASSRGAAIPYHDLLYGEHAIDRISEAEVMSQGDYEDENESATIWELSPTGQTIPKNTTKVFHAQYSQPGRNCWLSVSVRGDMYYQGTEDGYITRWENAHPPDANQSATTNLPLLRIGQTIAGAIYYVYRSYVRFDTSGIGAGETVVGAKLRMKLSSNRSDTDFGIQVRDNAWGAVLAVGDWDGTGALRATHETEGLPPANEWVEIDLPIAAIQKEAWTEFELMSDNEAVPPTQTEYASFLSGDSDDPPQLVIALVSSAPESETFENYGVGARIEVEATATKDLVIDAMTITGVPLRGSSEESKVVEASASPPAIERTLHHALPLQGTRTSSMETEADRLADRYDGRIRRCSLVLRPKTDAILTQMLAREIGELVHVENINDDFSTHMDANHWVEGIDHYFKMTPKSFETVFHLEEE